MNEDTLQDYIDGRLSPEERAAFAAYLLEHPDEAAYARDLMMQNEALRALGTEILAEDVPERLRAVLDEAPAVTAPQQQSGSKGIFVTWPAVAAMAAVFAIGVFAGWFGNTLTQTRISTDQLAAMSGRDAYMLYAVESSFPVEFARDRMNELDEWIGRVFETRVELPSLDDLGYQYVGGRLLPWSDGKFGFYLFENENASRVVLVWWPRAENPPLASRVLSSPGVQSRFWGTSGFGFAVYADEVNQDFMSLSDRVFEFYQTAFTNQSP